MMEDRLTYLLDRVMKLEKAIDRLMTELTQAKMRLNKWKSYTN